MSFTADWPQHRMGDPLGPIRSCPVAGSEERCGRMLKAAPVSTGKLVVDVNQEPRGDGVKPPRGL